MSRDAKKSVAAAIGAAFAGSLVAAGPTTASPNSNPFGLTELSGGYLQVASGHMEGKCGAGKCGAGNCGGNMG